MSSQSTVPTFEERERMWSSLDFETHSGSYPRTDEYVAALRPRFTNGQVHFRSFHFPTHPVFDWYFERNRLHECNFFERFWRTATPSKIFRPPLPSFNFFENSLFQWTTAFHLSGELSSLVFCGGAYSTSTGYGLEARRLGDAAATELLAGDYEQTLFFRCHSAWSDFFMDVAWDFTAIVVSKPLRIVHVLIATDTD